MGRNPVEDPKQRIEVWIKTSIIDMLGGKEKIKPKIIKFLEEESYKSTSKESKK